jgi:hypothetical protein
VGRGLKFHYHGRAVGGCGVALQVVPQYNVKRLRTEYRHISINKSTPHSRLDRASSSKQPLPRPPQCGRAHQIFPQYYMYSFICTTREARAPSIPTSRAIQLNSASASGSRFIIKATPSQPPVAVVHPQSHVCIMCEARAHRVSPHLEHPIDSASAPGSRFMIKATPSQPPIAVVRPHSHVCIMCEARAPSIPTSRASN